MWFDDQDITGRRLSLNRGRRAKTVLRVNARKRAGGKPSRVWPIVLGVVAVGAAVALVIFTLRWIGGLLFTHNDRFTITRIEVEAGPVIGPNLVREYTRIREGMNLFEINIAEVRREFLSRVPNARSMTINRQFPDTLRIRLTERVPLARIGWQGNLVADRDGMVFGLRSGRGGLPTITSQKPARLVPGQRLDGRALAAVEVLDACDNPALGLDVDVIEIDKDEGLVVWLSDGRSVILKWERMGDMSATSRKNLMEKLNGWANALQTQEGRQLSRFDATYEDRIYGR